VKPVTAIVLNWCNEHDTAACVESLRASHYEPLTILIVDNGSPDGSGDRLHARFPDAPYLQTGTNLGYAGGNNRGITWAIDHGADYVLIVNDDTVIDADCVGALVKAADETGAAAAAPRIVYFDDPHRVWYGGGAFSVSRAIGVHVLQDGDASVEQRRAHVTFVCGCCFLMRASVVRTVGAFDERFFAYVEDAELSHRLTRAGYTLVYEPQGRVLHRVRPGVVETPFQIRQRDRNRRRLVARHYGMFDRLRFAAWFYPTRAAHLARYAARGDWPRAGAIVDGMFGSIRERLSA
jgi:GT2 family glycosyltransferase